MLEIKKRKKKEKEHARWISVASDKYGMGMSSIFVTVFRYLPIFLTVLRYWAPSNVPLYLQHFMSIEQKFHMELSRNGSVHEFYRLKALITLEKVIASVVEKKNNLNEQNVEVY